MSTTPRRARHGVDPGRHVQPRRGVLRRRRSRQDHHRGGDGAAGRRVRPHGRGADHRPGQATRPGARHQGSRQHAAAGSARTRGHRRAARDDARHASHVRRDGDPVLGTRTRTKRFWTTSSTKPSPRRSPARRSTWRWRSSASCWPRTSGTSSSSTPRRRAMRWTSSTRQNGLGSFMDSRLWRLLLAPGRGIGKLVTGAVGLAMKALSTVLGSQMLSDAAAFVQSLDATFGGFREKADRTYELLKRRGTQFVVVSAAEPDALREASFFVDRLSQEQHAARRADPQPHPSDVVRPARRTRRPRPPTNSTADGSRVADGRGPADSRRPGADGQAGGSAAVAVHRRQPARCRSSAFRHCRSTCRISRRCAPSPIRSPARHPPRSREVGERY